MSSRDRKRALRYTQTGTSGAGLDSQEQAEPRRGLVQQNDYMIGSHQQQRHPQTKPSSSSSNR